MSNARNGPEFFPLKGIVKTFKIKVEICDKDDNIVRSEMMDYGSKEDRVWLGKLSYYAWSKGWYVVTEVAK